MGSSVNSPRANLEGPMFLRDSGGWLGFDIVQHWQARAAAAERGEPASGTGSRLARARAGCWPAAARPGEG